MLQEIVGSALFLFAGYAASTALFQKQGLVERAAFSLASAFTIPALVLAFLNLALSIPIDANLAYWVLLAFSAGCLAWSRIGKAKAH